MIRRVFALKRALQILFFINAVFICFGTMALIDFFRTHDVTSLELAAAGAAIFVVGIVIPTILFSLLGRAIKESALEAQKLLAQWLAGWVQSSKKYGDDSFHNPQFWTNISLLFLEIFGEKSSSRTARVLSEFAPVLRMEIEKRSHEAPSSRKKRKKRSA